MANHPTFLDDEIQGTPGTDLIDALDGNDKVWGNGGDDLLTGGWGRDSLYGGAGSDTLYGGHGGDLLVPGFDGRRDEKVDGGTGTDTLDVSDWGWPVWLDLRASEGASNTFSHVSEIEDVVGSAHADILEGSDAANLLTGVGGNDVLRGHGGVDTLFGGAGWDTLDGGAGTDQLWGGSGKDAFVYDAVGDSTPASRDVIYDFQDLDVLGAGSPYQMVVRDAIDLSAIDANPYAGGDQAFQLVTGEFTAAGQVRVRVVGGDTYVEANTDNYGSTAELQIQLDGVHNLTADNFVL